MTKSEKTFEDFIGKIIEPRAYGKRYLAAETIDDLIWILGEACLADAYSIVRIFKLPRRGSLILKIIKCFNKQSYNRHHYLYNFTFTHCLFYITRKMQQIIEPKIGSEAENLVYKAGGFACSYYGFLSRYSPEDNEALWHELKLRIADYLDVKVIDEKILFQNIIDGIERKIQPQQIAVFFRDTIAKDPLYFTEPFRFCERYVSLRNNQVSCAE